MDEFLVQVSCTQETCTRIILLQVATNRYERHASFLYKFLARLSPALLTWMCTHVVICVYCSGQLCMECKQVYNTGMRSYMLDSYNIVDFCVLSFYLASYTLRFLVDRWIKSADAFYDGTSRARVCLVERNRTEYDLITTEIFSDEQEPLHSYFMKACTFNVNEFTYNKLGYRLTYSLTYLQSFQVHYISMGGNKRI